MTSKLDAAYQERFYDSDWGGEAPAGVAALARYEALRAKRGETTIERHAEPSGVVHMASSATLLLSYGVNGERAPELRRAFTIYDIRTKGGLTREGVVRMRPKSTKPSA
jgi:hypothetical protein